MSWHLDKGLYVLCQQVRDRYPNIVIGTIGDKAHQQRRSDHNPEGDGSVDAADFMLGNGFDKNEAQWLVDTLVHHRDNRIAYIIWNRRIISSTVDPWVWRRYYGVDPHTNHVHVSVNDLHSDDKREWKLGGMHHSYEPLNDYRLPELRQGMRDSEYEGYWQITRLQKMVHAYPDGIYGPKTAEHVKNFLGYGDGKTVSLHDWVKIYGLSHK